MLFYDYVLECSDVQDELATTMNIVLRNNFKENVGIIFPSYKDIIYAASLFRDWYFKFNVSNPNISPPKSQLHLPILTTAEQLKHYNFKTVILVACGNITRFTDLDINSISHNEKIFATCSEAISEEVQPILDALFRTPKNSLTTNASSKPLQGFEQPKNINTVRHLRDIEIWVQFKKCFIEAQSEIDIISPWISENVLNHEIEDLMDTALQRGVTIKILYGIGDALDIRGQKSDECAARMSTRFKKYGDSFKIQRGNTHYKLLLCDESYEIQGSYNFLSFKGDYIGLDNRSEGADYQSNAELIRFKRNTYFNF